MKPDNCFRIGPSWGDQQWADFFAEERTAAFLEYQEGGPRIFVEWTKRGTLPGLVLGWCEPGSWVPAKVLPPVPCSDVKATLYAGGVGAPEEEWGVHTRVLFTAGQYPAVDLLGFLIVWRAAMIEKARKAGAVAGIVYLHWDEIAADPEKAQKILSRCGIEGESIRILWHPMGTCSLVLHFQDSGRRVSLGWLMPESDAIYADEAVRLIDNSWILGDLAPLGLGAPRDQAPTLVRRLFTGAKFDPATVRHFLTLMVTALRKGRNLPEPDPDPDPDPESESEPKPEPKPEPAAKPATDTPLSPGVPPEGTFRDFPWRTSLSKYGWTIHLSDSGKGLIQGQFTLFQPAGVKEGEGEKDSREVLNLTFNLNDEDKRGYQDVVRALTQADLSGAEVLFSHLLTILREAQKK